MPFQITITREFSAAHALRLYDGSVERLHGHNWRVSVTVDAAKLDQIGVVMDFHELERLVDDVVGPMHNRNLNELAPFAAGTAPLNPSAENVAMHVATALKLPTVVRLGKVEIWETANCCAVYLPS